MNLAMPKARRRSVPNTCMEKSNLSEEGGHEVDAASPLNFPPILLLSLPPPPSVPVPAGEIAAQLPGRESERERKTGARAIFESERLKGDKIVLTDVKNETSAL